MIPDLPLRVAAAAALALGPVLLLQGRRVRRVTPRLPEARGPRHGIAPGDGEPLRLLVLGESTAAGVGAPTQREGLAGQTAHALAARTGRPVRWRVLGRTGFSAHEVRTRLLAPAADVHADVAAVVLGVNDTLRFASPRRWSADLAALIADLRARCGPVPVVLSAVPPVHRFPALPQPLAGVLGLRAALLDRAAARLAATLTAVAHVPMPAATDDQAPLIFCEDRFHPSPHGYQLWGAALAREAEDRVLGPAAAPLAPGRDAP